MTQQEDHWSAEAYQNSASFVPKLATKVLGWLDVQPDDMILDVGCGDGIINLEIAQQLKSGKGSIHGVDSSQDMISSAQKAAKGKGVDGKCTFEVLDATALSTKRVLSSGRFDKVFSNAAMHWILRRESTRASFFSGVHSALKPNGVFVFEMGGIGNVAEMRAALLSVVGRRIGIERAREVDPWFFPDEKWMEGMLEGKGWKIEKIEREYRPTPADEGGIAGWVKLMGKQFFDAVGKEGTKERGEAETEVGEILETVCKSPGGGEWIGYVRLRVKARKILNGVAENERISG